MQRAGTLIFGAMCWVFCSLLLVGTALAQNQYNCGSFDSQAAAQRVLDRDPSDPNILDADNDGMACDTYDYGDGGGGGGDDGELDCADFTYQEEAQRIYNRDTSDPFGLDGPIGEAFDGEQGVPCEDLPHRPTPGDDGATPDGDDETPTGDQYTPEAPPGPVDDPDGVVPGSGTKKMPPTGGPPLVLGALALLGAALIAGRGILKR